MLYHDCCAQNIYIILYIHMYSSMNIYIYMCRHCLKCGRREREQVDCSGILRNIAIHIIQAHAVYSYCYCIIMYLCVRNTPLLASVLTCIPNVIPLVHVILLYGHVESLVHPLSFSRLPDQFYLDLMMLQQPSRKFFYITK